MSTRLRLTPALLIVTLIVIAGCSMQTAHADAEYNVGSKQWNKDSMNLGQMLVDGQGPYNLPHNIRLPGGKHTFTFILPPGYFFVVWEDDGVVRPLETTTVHEYGHEAGLGHDPTIIAIYQKNGLPAIVGGVVLSTNTLIVLAPYLALIGLIATTAAIAVKKRRN